MTESGGPFTMWLGWRFVSNGVRIKLLKKFRRGCRNQAAMWTCLVFVMTLFVVITQMCDESNCDRTDYHIISMRSKFSFQRYLDNVEDILKTLFQGSDNSASLSDLRLKLAHTKNTFHRPNQSSYETQIDMKSRSVKSLLGPGKGRSKRAAPKNDEPRQQKGKKQEHSALTDFRLRAQRVASICDAIAKNKTDSKGILFKAWERVALSISKAETVTGVLWHRPSQTSYCFVPKAGCTFWMRVFYFLQHNMDATVHSPWDIPRLAVHTTPQNPSARGAPLWYLGNEVLAPKAVRFLITRDPFSRLWSAYVDKLFLPDFWNTVGVDVVRRFRKDPDEVAKMCGNDVRFDEFVKHVLTTPNSHWDPVHSRCDPCRYQPQVIGQMDTFARDSTVILRRMGMGHVLSTVDRAAQNELELRTLIDYNLAVTRNKSELQRCISQDGTARLLWKAFQINGYLPLDVPYSSPLEGEEEGEGEGEADRQPEDEAGERKGAAEEGGERPFPQKKFADEVVRVFRRSGMTKAEMSAQRKSFMRKAYESLSPELLRGLQEMYRMDFLLFGYDTSPFQD